jgi:hypothetical protein
MTFEEAAAQAATAPWTPGSSPLSIDGWLILARDDAISVTAVLGLAERDPSWARIAVVRLDHEQPDLVLLHDDAWPADPRSRPVDDSPFVLTTSTASTHTGTGGWLTCLAGVAAAHVARVIARNGGERQIPISPKSGAWIALISSQTFDLAAFDEEGRELASYSYRPPPGIDHPSHA